MSGDGDTSVACIGGITLDIKAHADGRLEPGTSTPGTVYQGPGGVAGNVARSLAKLGVRVSIYALVGDDAAGVAVTAALRRDGVDTEGIRVMDGVATSSYVAVLDAAGEVAAAVADMGAMDTTGSAWLDHVRPALGVHGWWVVDANLPTDLLDRVCVSRPPGTRLLADPVSAAKAVRLRSVLSEIDVLAPNHLEAEALTGISVHDLRSAARAAEDLVAGGVAKVILKLGPRGVVVADRGGSRHLGAIRPDHVEDVTGAGDALAAGYLYGRLTGEPDPAACGLAAASLTVESRRSVAPYLSAERLVRRLSGASTGEPDGSGPAGVS